MTIQIIPYDFYFNKKAISTQKEYIWLSTDGKFHTDLRYE